MVNEATIDWSGSASQTPQKQPIKRKVSLYGGHRRHSLDSSRQASGALLGVRRAGDNYTHIYMYSFNPKQFTVNSDKVLRLAQGGPGVWTPGTKPSLRVKPLQWTDHLNSRKSDKLN